MEQVVAEWDGTLALGAPGYDKWIPAVSDGPRGWLVVGPGARKNLDRHRGRFGATDSDGARVSGEQYVEGMLQDFKDATTPSGDDTQSLREQAWISRGGSLKDILDMWPEKLQGLCCIANKYYRLRRMVEKKEGEPLPERGNTLIPYVRRRAVQIDVRHPSYVRTTWTPH